MFRNKATGTLNEIKRVTVEKLTNKIIRSFCLDLVMYIPFLMIIELQYRAAMTEPTRGCYGEMAQWLLGYAWIMLGFTVVRLFRLPVVRFFSMKWYLIYWILYNVAQFITVAVWFVKGNFSLFNSIY